MGEWDETDAITRFPIFEGELVHCFVVKTENHWWHGQSGKPFVEYCFGKYDGSGFVEGVDLSIYEKYKEGDFYSDKRGIIFVKDSVLKQVVDFVETEMKFEWNVISRRYMEEAVFSNHFYHIKSSEIASRGDFKELQEFASKSSKEQNKIYRECYPTECKNLELFCKLVCYASWMRIDLRNGIVSGGHKDDQVEYHEFLQKLMNDEFENLKKRYEE